MSERTFTVTMQEGERLMNLAALGFAVMRLPQQGEPAKIINNLIAKLCVTPEAQALAQAPPPVPAQPAPARTVDYFAADRKGNIPESAPDQAELQRVKITACTESVDRKYLKVSYIGGKANCFDRELWPRIKPFIGKEAQLWIAEKGSYLNIVGVRA